MNENSLKMLPKYEEYIVYMNKILIASPKICRMSIGDEFIKNMYQSLYAIYRLIYEKDKNRRIKICSEMDAMFAYQRALIRGMYELGYIDSKKKLNCIKQLGVLGKMLGGYIHSIGIANGKES